MTKPSRHARAGRSVIYVVALMMTAHCRCQYELIDAGTLNDSGTDSASDAAAPPSIVLGSETLTDRKGSAFGNAFSESCPANQVVFGIEGGVQPDGFELLTAIAFRCATLTVAADGVTVIVSAAGTTPQHGDTSFSIPFSQACPTNQVVSGFEGNAGSSIDGVTLQCSPISVQDGLVVLGAATAIVPAIGGNGGTPYNEPCPAGQIVRGGFGFENGVLQGFGMACAAPSLVAPP